jgi:hypothetical protein
MIDATIDQLTDAELVARPAPFDPVGNAGGPRLRVQCCPQRSAADMHEAPRTRRADAGKCRNQVVVSLLGDEPADRRAARVEEMLPRQAEQRLALFALAVQLQPQEMAIYLAIWYLEILHIQMQLGLQQQEMVAHGVGHQNQLA